jgi:hypothetical protein
MIKSYKNTKLVKTYEDLELKNSRDIIIVYTDIARDNILMIPELKSESYLIEILRFN